MSKSKCPYSWQWLGRSGNNPILQSGFEISEFSNFSRIHIASTYCKFSSPQKLKQYQGKIINHYTNHSACVPRNTQRLVKSVESSHILWGKNNKIGKHFISFWSFIDNPWKSLWLPLFAWLGNIAGIFGGSALIIGLQ